MKDEAEFLSHTGYNIKIRSWSGRLGNHIWQLSHAIHIAKSTNSKVSFPNHPLFSKLTIDFSIPEKPKETIEGRFLLKDECYQFPIPDHSTFREILQTYILPHITHPPLLLKLMGTLAPGSDFGKLPNSFPGDHLFLPTEKANEITSDTLVINIRSGKDLFRQNPPPQNDYMQPPLSFYTTIIKNHHSPDCLIVTEPDRMNPVIPALLCFRKGVRIKQHDGILGDIDTLLSARHLAISHSTFSWTLALMSKNVKTIHSLKTFPIRGLANTSVREYAFENYINPGEWTASPKQLALMLSHSEHDIITSSCDLNTPKLEN